MSGVGCLVPPLCRSSPGVLTRQVQEDSGVPHVSSGAALGQSASPTERPPCKFFLTRTGSIFLWWPQTLATSKQGQASPFLENPDDLFPTLASGEPRWPLALALRYPASTQPLARSPGQWAHD